MYHQVRRRSHGSTLHYLIPCSPLLQLRLMPISSNGFIDLLGHSLRPPGMDLAGNDLPVSRETRVHLDVLRDVMRLLSPVERRENFPNIYAVWSFEVPTILV